MDKKNVLVVFNPDMYNQLKEIGDSEELSVSDIIRRSCRMYINSKDKVSDTKKDKVDTFGVGSIDPYKDIIN